MAEMSFSVKPQVCVIVLILLLNIRNIKPSLDTSCLKFEDKTCHIRSDPYRLYGTKTAYNLVRKNSSDDELNFGECVPKMFYLLCRHASRYPDRKDIEKMIKILPVIKDKINNASLYAEVKICKEDLKVLNNWTEQLKPEYDNSISPLGETEAFELAERLKRRFPTLLDQNYSPEKFVFEYTSRNRTKTTAESFARGLFNNDSSKISFDGVNDDVLQFHKGCNVMKKNCSDTSYDTSEIDKFEKGPLMQKVIEIISSRVGFKLTYDEVKIIYKACAFGYVLKTGDIWCSLFSSDDLKVLEFDGDIDDYYKDAYGNKVNYEQACPVVQHILNLFESFSNTSESKAVFQFSHAGGIKKVFSRFGLFQDDKPLKADGFCSQQNRKWRSSFVTPFLANLALVLYDCGSENKIAAFHNENLIKLGGCKDKFCSYQEFYEKYMPIAENCDMKSICCTCCVA